MNYSKDIFRFIVLLFTHIFLLSLFSLNYYSVYFLFLALIAYGLHKFGLFLSLKKLLLYTAIVFYVINLEIYEDLSFELFLYLNLLDSLLYINSEVMYILSALHILLLINLKKFDTFWVIMDEKLFRNAKDVYKRVKVFVVGRFY